MNIIRKKIPVLSGNEYQGPRMSSEALMKRLRNVVENELTDHQREIFESYYFQDKDIPTIAQELGRNKSSVSRCLHRAINQVRTCLKY